MISRNLRVFALFGLLLLSFARPDARAQRPRAGLDDTYDTYSGPAVWRQPDGGATLRGTAYVNIHVVGGTGGQANSLQLQVVFGFGIMDPPDESFVGYAYRFTGKMDPNGRGFVRFESDFLDYPHPQPALNPGKVSVLFTPKDNVVRGGVLADDGTELTFRADSTSGGTTPRP